MADDGWGELFQKAADIAPSHKNASVSAPPDAFSRQNHDLDRDENDGHRCLSRRHEDGTDGHSKRKRRKGIRDKDDGGVLKSSKPRKRQRPNDASFEAMLRTRTDPHPASSWPFWTRHLTTGLEGPSSCSAWLNHDKEDIEPTAPSLSGFPSSRVRCVHCGKPDIHHKMQFYSSVSSPSRSPSEWSKQTAWPILLFSNLRNIRCMSKLIAKSSGRREEVTFLIRSIQNETGTISNLRPVLEKCLPAEEGSLLVSKLDKLRSRVCVLQKPGRTGKGNTTVSTTGRTSLMENAIRILVAADEAYYRLYYLQLTGLLPTLHVDIEDAADGESVRIFLPHPQEYFSVLLGSVDDIAQETTNFFPQKQTNGMPVGPMLSYCDNVRKANEVVGRKCNDNALATIFKYRWWETVELFYNTGWSTSDEVKTSVVGALRNFPTNAPPLEQHETPAPPLLMEWRDSCRDFMCNLYAYATFPPDTVWRLLSLLRHHRIGRLVELGAGTGYVARLLSNEATEVVKGGHSLTVEAYDKYPTPKVQFSGSTDMNEYHGHTPPFFKVNPLPCFSRSETRDTALLLCYPPPQSAMACDHLKSYLANGGTFVVHVGEFKGLTGDKAFETLLLNKLVCVERLPTLTWGTDASHVTVWILKEQVSNCVIDLGGSFVSDHGALLPCSNCTVREARKRCRLDRSLVYCSETCFEEGKDARKLQLRVRMMEVDPRFLRYEEPLHFLEL